MDVESIIEKGISVVADIAVVIIDCFEESFNNMTFASGKNFLYVVLVVASTIPVSIVVRSLKLFSFISVDEAVISTIAIVIIYFLNSANKQVVKGSLEKFKNKAIDVTKKGGMQIGKHRQFNSTSNKVSDRCEREYEPEPEDSVIEDAD